MNGEKVVHKINPSEAEVPAEEPVVSDKQKEMIVDLLEGVERPKPDKIPEFESEAGEEPSMEEIKKDLEKKKEPEKLVEPAVVPVVKAPVGEKVAEAAPPPPAPAEEEPKAEPSLLERELEELRSTNKSLLEQLNLLAGKFVSTQQAVPSMPAAPKPTAAPAAPAAISPAAPPAAGQAIAPTPAKEAEGLVSFLGAGEEEDVLLHPDKLNVVLNKVYAHTVEDVLRRVPPLVSSLTQHLVMLNEAIRDFYQANPDLSPHKSYVGLVANELGSEHPDWTYEQLFKEVATEIRKRLRISGIVGQPPAAASVPTPPAPPAQPKRPSPAFAPGGGPRGKAGELPPLVKEIGELLRD